MKTYKSVAILLMAFSFVACDKSTDGISEESQTTVTADYTIFLKGSNRLDTQILTSAQDGLVVKDETSAFVSTPLRSLKYRTSEKISYYSTSNCEATVQVYDVIKDTSIALEVFTDLDVCSIEVTAMAHTDESIFLSYVRELEGKDRQYVLRFISLTEGTPTFVDIPLDERPVDLVPSTNRLFVLTLNEFVTDDFHLQVIDIASRESLMELDLGYDATKLFKNNLEEVIISYPELHTTLDPVTLDKKYTMYGENTAPGFLTSKDFFIDSSGKLYFQKTIASAAIATVPAIYDFQKNKTVVYLFENFLSETELNVKYNIAATTAIGFDEKNDFILIGYQKKAQQDKGGILRISPSPDLKIIDNLDLDGVPQTIFVH
ncbi:hypothetical protein ACNR9Q_13260 [Maribacter sp. X9]|uniref:hypothetical protein n=1 Tax=Maribacter sp. X9 TaxID=3402159 RepID=UPI003AF36093